MKPDEIMDGERVDGEKDGRLRSETLGHEEGTEKRRNWQRSDDEAGGQWRERGVWEATRRSRVGGRASSPAVPDAADGPASRGLRPLGSEMWGSWEGLFGTKEQIHTWSDHQQQKRGQERYFTFTF